MTTEVRYLVDTSAIVRLTRPEVAEALAPLIEAGKVATCAVIDLELYSQLRDQTQLAEIKMLRAASFHWVPTDDDDLRRALEVQAALTETPVPWTTLVVAAVAERHLMTVLHCEPAFDRIAKKTGQPIEWLVAP